ncbi:TetR/AcrR family transcriptional regulator [Streptococcus gallolyticus]|uniref:TetR/AcrR family transcriptional regulator n=1 Tax=Streptococcus hepaticus TaxID=3349163 RepID=UPI001C95A039|nr:TetR/AcrR family transcriptional regulator [Streptococcus gallolyticus]MBY5041806.1 TetR/AcrR family transcriptional regulator [Streptococcus gallolyticus]
MKQTEHARAQRSQELSIRALLSLMYRFPYDEITVKEIVAEAGITRQTFYRNFTSKEDVLRSYFSYLYEECAHYLANKEGVCLQDVFTSYFEFWDQYRQGIQTFYEQNSPSKMNNLTLPYLYQLYPYFSNYLLSDFDENYLQDFIFGGLVQVKSSWIQRGCDISAIEMAQQLGKLVAFVEKK